MERADTGMIVGEEDDFSCCFTAKAVTWVTSA
jgi:hypothetical protein